MQQKIILTTTEELRELVTDIIRSEKPNLPESTKQENLLSRKQAAALLGITLPTLWDWTRTGKVQGYRISRRVYYKRDELDAALKGMNILGRRGGNLQ
jgi:excisionase family DNA binding protein